MNLDDLGLLLMTTVAAVIPPAAKPIEGDQVTTRHVDMVADSPHRRRIIAIEIKIEDETTFATAITRMTRNVAADRVVPAVEAVAVARPLVVPVVARGRHRLLPRTAVAVLAPAVAIRDDEGRLASGHLSSFSYLGVFHCKHNLSLTHTGNYISTMRLN